MNPRHSIAWLLLLVLPLGFAGVWKLQQNIDVQQASLQQEQDEMVLRSGKLIRMMSFEYAPLMADIYWTRVVQYYGGKHARYDANLALLWPLLDVTTTLDPNLLVAYRFGATFLSEAPPRGLGRPDLAVDLLQRGIRANPEYWRFYEDLGFVYYFDMKDYPKAAAAFLEGSKNPNAFIWMKVLAAKVTEQGESRETSTFLWTEIYLSAKDPLIKQNALTHLELLRADAECEQLNAISAEYEKRTGRRPATLRELVHAGLLTAEPLDPRGYVYQIGPQGEAQINPASPLFKEKPRYQKPL
jgi:hypothetical protein